MDMYGSDVCLFGKAQLAKAKARLQVNSMSWAKQVNHLQCDLNWMNKGKLFFQDCGGDIQVFCLKDRRRCFLWAVGIK